MKLVNLTPHDIIVRTAKGDLSVKPSGQIARIQTDQVVSETVKIEGAEVPVVTTVFGDVVGLPDPQPGVVYIVSSLVLQAVRGKRDDVIAPDTGPSAIRENGRVLAVTRFQK